MIEASGTDGRLVLRHDSDRSELRSVWYGLDARLPRGTRIQAGEVLGVVADATADGTAPGESLLGPGIQVQVVSSAERRKKNTIANVAIARELAGWSWSLAVFEE